MTERENGWYLRSDGYMTSEYSYQRIEAMKGNRALDNHQKLVFVKLMGGEEKDSRVYVPHPGACHITASATAGNGTLTAEQVREAIMSADRWEKPMGNTGLTNTHLIIRDDAWQAIADELNAMVGNGTCEFELNTDMTAIRCDKCGYELPKGTDLKATRFCGGCGRMAR